MFDKLRSTEQHYEEISERLTDPAVISDNKQYAALMKEYKSLTPVVEKYREYVKYVQSRDEAREMLEESGIDKDMKELAQSEFEENSAAAEKCAEELKILLLPKDPNDDRNV
ncbi:MAG: PCRF domain-containing protein, partial [Oscillospiraceae bacterium]